MKRFLLLLIVASAGPGAPLPAGEPAFRAFVGTITDTECGPSHARMIAKGGMGDTDAECTRACIRLGATYGVVVGRKRKFLQLDDQEKPASFAGRRVRIIGRRRGDTIFVESIAPEGEARKLTRRP